MNANLPVDKIRPLQSVARFDYETDVLVCGYGGAGAAAALEAALAGAQVLVLERASAGGGATAMSSCEMYLGGSGGTALQKATGFEDSTENMAAYLREALGPLGDDERIRCYAEGAAAHFDWAESLGVPYKRAAFLERTVVPLTDESLLFTGNEKSHPFNRVAAPVPRGHVPSREGDEGGQLFMNAIMARVSEAGAEVLADTRLLALLRDEQGAICGAVAKRENREICIRAHRGVVLTTGGFVMNQEMTRQYLPEINQYAVPYGSSNDIGDGIVLGLAAGGQVINMDQAFLSFPLYPPAKLTYGVLLNARGERYINEDAYLARLAWYSCQQPGQKFYLLVQEEDYAASDYLERAPVVATGDTIAEVAAEAPFPAGKLEQTVSYFNQYAAQGEDPLFHKAAEWLKPLSKPPYALVEYSANEMRAVIVPGSAGPLMFTLGGLKTRTTGEVLDVSDRPIPGLYAAGRATAGLPRSGKGYASGMSVGDATFFGRRAGQAVAARSI
ncbi:FAD-dependent oxidoreductase [Parahaliea maris]|uniref:FAD-dependent oxidoreductase n=1 Tax=Parahaliea maris TaxID=2716870 RepID=A0A5C8ZMY1_9GAMM|nr:FAD-dependent oxidoreductase [Parahaliea maris]TXS89818.1 FAD-dependent oxidoreductase [Parahaliea maris]